MNYLKPVRKSLYVMAAFVAMGLYSCDEELIPDVPDLPECEDISFSSTKDEESNSYTFTLSDPDALSDIVWTLNGDTVPTETVGRVLVDLPTGSNEICVSGISIACLDLLGFCATIEVSAADGGDGNNGGDGNDGGGEEQCPEIDFSFSKDDANEYIFELSQAEVASISWKIDGEEVEAPETIFSSKLSPGVREVCVTATFENCSTEVTYCATIEVAEVCPNVKFEYAIAADNKVVFELLNENATSSIWKIDGEVAGQDPFAFDTTLSPGSYEVCVTSTFVDCASGVTYCETITIEEVCPEIEIEKTETISGYKFELDLGNSDLTPSSIEWLVDGQTRSSDVIYSVSLPAGTYDICAIVGFETCTTTQEVCKTITIEEEEEKAGCPEMFFAYNQSSVDPPVYVFNADFEGIENLEWYGWYINDEPVEDEGSINNGDNMLQYAFDGPGTYNVCIFTETPDCPSGTGYCVELVIE